MRYYKRVDNEGKAITYESYSFDSAIEGALEITKEEFDAFMAAIPVIVKPDVAGFNKAVITAFGPQLANSWLAKYPLFSKAMDAGDWDTAAAMLDVAGAEGTITSAQAVTLRDAAIQFHLVPADWKK